MPRNIFLKLFALSLLFLVACAGGEQPASSLSKKQVALTQGKKLPVPSPASHQALRARQWSQRQRLVQYKAKRKQKRSQHRQRLDAIRQQLLQRAQGLRQRYQQYKQNR